MAKRKSKTIDKHERRQSVTKIAKSKAVGKMTLSGINRKSNKINACVSSTLSNPEQRKPQIVSKSIFSIIFPLSFSFERFI